MVRLQQSSYSDDASVYPGWSLLLRRVQILAGIAGVAATIGLHSGHALSPVFDMLLRCSVWLSLVLAIATQGIRYSWSRARASFLHENRLDLLISGVWLAGLLPLAFVSDWSSGALHGLLESWLAWAQIVALLRGIHELYVGLHHLVDAGLSPALVLVLSFASLIGVGTILLMFPVCRPEGLPPASFSKALFTATSAGCVTGLVLDPPGEYWSRTGQIVLLVLIQLGGLGIMTFSAFFAFVLGSKLPVREQMTFRELLDSDRMGDVSSIIRAILGLTLGIELLGSFLLMTLWTDLPWSERFFFGMFHSVSAFCNAGFCLRTESFQGWELRWQVFAVVPFLIVLGGIGFGVIDNWRRVIRHRCFEPLTLGVANTARPRVTLSTQLVTITTLVLLLSGWGLLWLLEYDNPQFPRATERQAVNAWFHSVTLRTAGFNTIDHEHLRPATKLLSIAFMFIGASPGSTGGGVKTICLALMFLTLRAVLRGRPAVETGKRTIPEEQVFRGLAIISLGLATLTLASLLLVMIENRPERIVDQLYEAASAFGTVGVSANLTPTLKPASQYVLIVTMFLGRVGPLTLIVALAGFNRPRGYTYPEERLSLG